MIFLIAFRYRIVLIEKKVKELIRLSGSCENKKKYHSIG